MGARLYSKIRDNLKREAQQKQFGKFLSDLDLNIIDKDYHHILKSHIHEGNKNSIKNVFRFFNIVVHYDDANIDNCVSLKREQVRSVDRNKNFEEKKNNTDHNDNTINTSADKNIWTLKQIYHQTQLDLIHAYLVHSSWKHMIHRYANEYHHPDEDEMENEEEKTCDIIPNKDKYVSDVIQNKEFGYGVVHEYHQLKPKYNSLYDEMIQNNQYSIEEDTFVKILIKAIRKHEIALSNEYKDKLICKVYNRKYRMIRNQMIGIKHILSIIIYTDLSKFCTAFRSTYRRVNNETTDEEVTKRHRQLYYYARCLYEAVDFFGQEMSPNDSVYHGLNALMQFEKFTAYFNQPLSTTPSFKIAQQFSQSAGIILRLKSGKSAALEANSSKIPKYLSVNWLSCFPNEDEKLFYGSYVVLQIADITEAENLKQHKKELKMFDKFQKAIQNQPVIWNEDRNGAMIDALKTLIQKQQNNVAYDEKEEKSQYITEYGSNLFKFFCHHPNTTIVCIRNFQSLPKPLHEALFLNQDNCISMIPILKLFPNLKEIILNELDIQQMTAKCRKYLDVVLECIRNKDNHYGNKLKKISFKSTQNDGKQNSTLKKLEKSNLKRLKKYQWTIEYEYQIENTHNLTFNNSAIEIADKIRELEKQQQKDKEELFKLHKLKEKELNALQSELARNKMEAEKLRTQKNIDDETIQQKQRALVNDRMKLETERKTLENKLFAWVENEQKEIQDLEARKRHIKELFNGFDTSAGYEQIGENYIRQLQVFQTADVQPLIDPREAQRKRQSILKRNREKKRYSIARKRAVLNDQHLGRVNVNQMNKSIDQSAFKEIGYLINENGRVLPLANKEQKDELLSMSLDDSTYQQLQDATTVYVFEILLKYYNFRRKQIGKHTTKDKKSGNIKGLDYKYKTLMYSPNFKKCETVFVILPPYRAGICYWNLCIDKGIGYGTILSYVEFASTLKVNNRKCGVLLLDPKGIDTHSTPYSIYKIYDKYLSPRIKSKSLKNIIFIGVLNEGNLISYLLDKRGNELKNVIKSCIFLGCNDPYMPENITDQIYQKCGINFVNSTFKIGKDLIETKPNGDKYTIPRKSSGIAHFCCINAYPVVVECIKKALFHK